MSGLERKIRQNSVKTLVPAQPLTPPPLCSQIGLIELAMKVWFKLKIPWAESI